MDEEEFGYQKGGFYKLFPFLSLLLVICIAGVYFGNLLFGNNSLKVLLELREKEREMSQEVKNLMSENAELQKEFFKLKGLEPQ